VHFVPLRSFVFQTAFDEQYTVYKFERLRAQQCEAQRQAEHLFQTLLHRAFRGVDLTDFENLSGLGMRSS
jgi:type I restriction enzyme S subunit